MQYRIHTYYFIMFPFVFRDEYLAYKAALFFCINPSSVLFTSPMTLSLLAASSFTALASIENGMGLFSGAYLAVASATHPSALLGLLMVLYNSMRQVATQTILLVSIHSNFHQKIFLQLKNRSFYNSSCCSLGKNSQEKFNN